MAPEADYYEILGVPANADPDEIRKAFRERVRACHPDRVANLDVDLRKLAEEKMVELNEAYAVLRNPARRATYDHRRTNNTAASTAAASPPAAAASPPPSATHADPAPPRSGAPVVDPAHSRNRIGEQQFVARAAAEEFDQTVKSCVAGRVVWTPVDFRGATLALHGTLGRKNLYFILYAAPQLDDKQLRRFLRSLEAFAAKLKSGLWGQNRVFGFAAAVEFADQARQRTVLTAFNARRANTDVVRPATLIDLVNWHVVPGEIGLRERLQDLLQGRPRA